MFFVHLIFDFLLSFLRNKIGYEEIEKFYVLYLSSSNEVIEFEENSVEKWTIY